MRAALAARYVAAVSAIGAVVLGAASWVTPTPAQGENNFLHNGEAGFVVAHIGYALSDEEGAQSGACPNGLTQGYANQGDPFPDRPEFQRREGELDSAWGGRVWRVAIRDDSVRNTCMNPEIGVPEPTFRTVERRDAVALGIDLDGQDSRAGGSVCGHNDLRGVNGQRGVDNQWFRVVGCGWSFQPAGYGNDFDTDMYTGAWGLLITVKGVDDVRNDDEVEVGISANNDPIELSAARTALPDATYAMHQNPRYRGTARGRIVNGVLTTEPFEFAFVTVMGQMFVERPLRDARIQGTFTADGGLDGFLAGYTPIEAMYDAQYGFRTAFFRTGEQADYHNQVQAAVGNRYRYRDTCAGAYAAIHRYADGHPDPQTGRCTTISNQYRFRAVRAFVVDEATASLNEDLGNALEK